MIALLPGAIEIAYDDAGSGLPLILLHGWPHNRTLWAAQTSGLVTQARCIAPDLRGFGESSVKPPFTIDQYADDVIHLMDSLHIEQAVVCGLSMGGYVALSILRRYPNRVRAAILASTRATADTDEARAKRMRLIEFVKEHGSSALAARQHKAMVGKTTFESRPDVVEALRQLMAGTPQAGVIGGLTAMAEREDSTSLLADTRIPVMVVSGAEDTFTPPDELRALAAAIPRARFESLEGAGHVCALERPASFNHVVTEFLATLVYH